MEPRQQLDFASVYSEHAPYVRGELARRGVRAADVDDVLQEVFVTVHQRLPSFEGRSRIETWLHAVTWRVAANYRRRQRSQSELSEDVLPAAGGDESDATIDDEQLHAGLSDVDELQRDLLALSDVGGLSISELSSLTGNARATIRQRLDRGRAALGRRMWKALTNHDQEAWLERLLEGMSPPSSVDLPTLSRPIFCDGSILCTLDDMVIAIWRGPSSFSAFAQMAGVISSISQSNPRGFRYLAVVEPTSTPPTREARQLMTWMCGRFGPKTNAVAAAIESSRLMTLVAPVMNSSLFLSRIPVNARFFDGVGRAASWIAGYGARDAGEISDYVEAMRKRLDESTNGRPT